MKMARKTHKEILGLIASSREMVPINSVWKHYGGTEYRVCEISIDEGFLRPLVTYHPVDNPDLFFTRLLQDWLGVCEYGDKIVNRYERVK
jgi:hypothetical protein